MTDTTSYRQSLVQRAQAIRDSGKQTVIDDLAKAWGDSGIPGLKGGHRHSPGELGRIEEMLANAEFAAGIAPPTTDEAPAGPTEEQRQALAARLAKLPLDLSRHIDQQGLAAGLPHLDRDTMTQEQYDWLTGLVAEAEDLAGQRLRQIHAALGTVGVDDDDVRHALCRQISSGRTESSAQLIDIETARLVDWCTAIELDKAQMGYDGSAGSAHVADRDGEALPGVWPPDWRTHARAIGVTGKELLAIAKDLAGKHGEQPPKKLGDVTDPAMCAAVHIAGILSKDLGSGDAGADPAAATADPTAGTPAASEGQQEAPPEPSTSADGPPSTGDHAAGSQSEVATPADSQEDGAKATGPGPVTPDAAASGGTAPPPPADVPFDPERHDGAPGSGTEEGHLRPDELPSAALVVIHTPAGMETVLCPPERAAAALAAARGAA